MRLPMAPRHDPELHVHPVHEFYIAHRGGWQHIKGAVLAMKHGDCFLFPAGMPHIGSGAEHGLSEGLVLNVDPRLLDDAAQTGLEARRMLDALCRHVHRHGPAISLSPEGRRQAARAMMRVIAEHADWRPARNMAIVSAIQAFLVVLARDGTCAAMCRPSLLENDHNSQRIEMVCYWIAQHCFDQISVAQAATLAGLKRSRFHEVFRAATGETFTAYLTRLRIEAAQRLLVESRRPVLDICFHVGFNSVSRFYAAFRERSGHSPQAWRDQHQGRQESAAPA